MENKSKKSTLIGWGMGDFGFQLMIYVSVAYFSAFLTDYAELPIGLAGVILTITGIGDAVTQPFSGVLVTKMNMRWGKYRSWYIVGPPIVLAAFVMTFTKIGSPVVTAAIIFIFYVIARFTFNCIWASHLALIPYVGKSNKERSFMSASRGIWQSAGTLLFSAVGLFIMTKLTDAFGKVNGFTLFAFIFGLCMWAGYTVSFIATKGTPEPTQLTERKKEKVGAKSFVMSIIKNPPLLFLMLAETARNLSQFMFTMFIFYYFKYTTEAFLMYSLFMTISNVVKLFGAGITTWICGKIGAKNTYLIGTLGNALFFILAFFFAGNTTLFMVFCSLAFLAVALPTGATSLMFGQCGQYSQWKTGKDNRAFVTGLIGFPVKIASFVKGPLMSVALLGMGFVANAEVVTQQVVTGIRFQTAVMPAIWSIVSAFFILFYGLNNKKVHEMETALEAVAE